ncbi:MAG: hypothetical protein WC393_02620 [Candidatus Nanoarchaeia archaeon]|jgi:hypothetical protein
MNQTKIKNNYKEQETKKTMEKRLLITTLMLLTLTLSPAFSEDVCRYIAGQTMFRCNDVLPNIVLIPGQEQNLTVYCCLTGDGLENITINNVNLKILTNETSRKQISEESELKVITILKFYNASNWIINSYIPENIYGFEAFPITLTFQMPYFTNEISVGEIVKARFDVSVDINGNMVAQQSILPNIMLPADYKPIDYKVYIYSIGGAFLLIILLVITFKNNKINQKIKRLFKKHKKSEAHHEPDKETKEQKVEKKEEEKKNE